MMRRRPGMAGVAAEQARKEALKHAGQELMQQRLVQVREGMEQLRERLQEFASKHRSEINKDPVFRKHFASMCVEAGVDPLSSSKGFWGELLGVGDFYFDLGVQMIDVCVKTRPLNGGLIAVDELIRRINVMRGRGAQRSAVTLEDIQTAISKLAVFGNGYRIVMAGGKHLLQSVPMELNRDHLEVLKVADAAGCVPYNAAVQQLGGSTERADRVFELLLGEGVVWLDREGRSYWLAGVLFADAAPTQ